MTELWDDFGPAVDRMTNQDLDELARRGVPDFGFIRAVPGARVGRLRIEANDGFWQPAEHGGQEMLIIADGLLHYPNGRDRAPALVSLEELIACDPDHPAAGWRVRRGDRPILGWQQLSEAQFWNLPITLHPDPWRWLLAGGTGCVILDWQADLRSLFDSVGSVRPTSESLTKRFQQRIEELSRPRIRVDFSGALHEQRKRSGAGASATTGRD